MHRPQLALLVFICIITLLGCSGSQDPTIPGPLANPQSTQSDNSNVTHRDLWGWWEVSINTTNENVEIIPMRTAQFRANVTQWMQQPLGDPNNLTIDVVDMSTYSTDGRISVDVSLTHPFPGLVEYTGFDVHGIFMHDGPIGGKDDPGVSYSYESVDAAILENADGFTRWWNYTEFTGPLPILGFTPGALANLANPSATLNPYKYFTNSLESEDDLIDYLKTPDGEEDRGLYLAGTVNTRRYDLRFPMDGDIPLLTFQYAVSASWEPGDPALSGGTDTWEAPGDFPISANQQEAVAIQISTVASTLFWSDSMTFGGSLVMDIEVFDRQGPYSISGVPGEISRIAIESPDVLIPNPGNVASYDGPALDAILVPGSGSAISSVWHVEIADCNPGGSDTFPLLVTVESTDPDTFDQGYGQGVPDSPLAAYQLGWVAVGDCNPPVAFATATTDTTINEGDSVEFDASGSTGIPPLTYEWDWDGDGSWDETGGPVISHQFDDQGDFYVNLRVSNACGEDDLDNPILIQVVGSWPFFQYDEKCSGIAPTDLVLPLTLKWDVTPMSGGKIDFAPVVAEGKVFYVDSGPDRCVALDESDGSYLWDYDIDPGNQSWGYWTAPGYSNGRVFCGGNYLHCLDADDGSLIWQFGSLGQYYNYCFGSVLVHDGIVYGPRIDGTMHALDETDGSFIWSHHIGYGFGCYHPPAIANDVGIFGASLNSSVHGRNRLTGSYVWQWSNSNPGGDRSMRVAPTVNGSNVYFGAYTQHIFCLDNQTGVEQWSYPTPGKFPFNAGCFYDGAYFQPTWGSSGNPGVLYAINEDGTFRWSLPSPNNTNFRSDVVASGGYIYAADGTTIRALDPQSGAEVWSQNAPGYINGGFAIANHCLYTGTSNGHVVCFEDAS